MAAASYPTKENYQTFVEQSKKRARDLLVTTSTIDGWKVLKSSSIPKGLVIYEKKLGGSPLITVRGEIDGVKAPAWDVANWVYSAESLPILDKMAKLDEAKLIDVFDSKSSVMYCPYNVPWPLDTRDFLWFQHWDSIEEEGGAVECLVGFSVVHPDCPERPGHVRGKIYDSGYIFKPTGPNTCKISYIVCIDPMGWVPSWANTKTAEQVYGLAYAKQHFEKNPITETKKPTQS